MAKFKEKIEARKLRKKGESIKDIAKKLGVSKGSASIWCRDIELTKKQIARLEEKQRKGGYIGRLKGARIQHERRIKRIAEFQKTGTKELGRLSKRDLFFMGIGLYWGEGTKTGTTARFHNSDPDSIKFMMYWFRKIKKIPDKQLTLYYIINEMHKKRLRDVTEYWSRLTDIPKEQFRKPILAKVKNKKVYKNFNEHYGTLTIQVNKSYDLFFKIQGYVKAINKKCRGSSVG